MNQTQLLALLGPVVAGLDLELEAVEVVPAGRRRLVRVVVDGDGPEGAGPTLDEIADATKEISAALDASDLTGDAPYTLEVSSRGVGRPLEQPQHWRRNRGRLVEVSLRSGEQVTGRIVAGGADTVTLQTDTGEREVVLAEVARALVQVEFNRARSTGEED